MILKEYKNNIPYFLIERKILFKLKKKYSLILTTAGKNAPIEIRKKLGYDNVSSWKIHMYDKNLKYRLKNIFSILIYKSKETKSSILQKIKKHKLSFIFNPSLDLLCRVSKKNLQNNVISFYPDKDYILWRFIKNPYHRYFSAIIDVVNNKKIAVIWYEVKRTEYLTDVIIEYLSFPKNLQLKYIFEKLKYIFNSERIQCRFVYRQAKKNISSNFVKNVSSLLIRFNIEKMRSQDIYFDSAIRQGIYN